MKPGSLKLIPYGRQSVDVQDVDAVAGVLISDWLTQGPQVARFEEALTRYTGAKYAVAMANGTAALHAACLAAGLKPKEEGITSPITFVASSNSILYCGARPMFADVLPDTVNIDPERIIKKITRRTKLVMPVHFAGLPCEMKEIKAVADRRGLFVIEDAAHALGAEYRGHKIGSCRYSDMTVFSFHPVKSITTGEGGAVTTNDRKLFERLSLLRTHGIVRDDAAFVGESHGPWYHEMQALGINGRITDFQCALGTSQLKRLDDFIARRREISAVYDKALADIDEIILPADQADRRSARHIYYIRLKNAARRRAVFDRLRSLGIGVQVHYIPVYLQPYYRSLGFKAGSCPAAEDYYARTISLPLFPTLSGPDIKRVVRCLHDVFAGGDRNVR